MFRSCRQLWLNGGECVLLCCAELEDEVSQLQQLVEAASGNAGALQERAKSLEEEIAVLHDKVAEASSHELALQEMQAAADGYKSAMEKHSLRVAELQELLSKPAAESEEAQLLRDTVDALFTKLRSYLTKQEELLPPLCQPSSQVHSF